MDITSFGTLSELTFKNAFLNSCPHRYAEAFDLLKLYSDGRLRLLARAAANRFDNLPGVPTVAANALDRAIVAVATSALQRVLLSPQAMLEQNPALAAQPVSVCLTLRSS